MTTRPGIAFDKVVFIAESGYPSLPVRRRYTIYADGRVTCTASSPSWFRGERERSYEKATVPYEEVCSLFESLYRIIKSPDMGFDFITDIVAELVVHYSEETHFETFRRMPASEAGDSFSLLGDFVAKVLPVE